LGAVFEPLTLSFAADNASVQELRKAVRRQPQREWLKLIDVQRWEGPQAKEPVDPGDITAAREAAREKTKVAEMRRLAGKAYDMRGESLALSFRRRAMLGRSRFVGWAIARPDGTVLPQTHHAWGEACAAATACGGEVVFAMSQGTRADQDVAPMASGV
jgi:hypothetical protein